MALLYGLNSIIALTALAGINIPNYGFVEARGLHKNLFILIPHRALKRLAILFTLIGEVMWLNIPSTLPLVLSVLVILGGTVPVNPQVSNY